MVEHSTLKICT